MEILRIDIGLLIQLCVYSSVIRKLTGVVCTHIDICRLQIAVDHIEMMEVFKSLNYLFSVMCYSVFIPSVSHSYTHKLEVR